MRLAATTRRCAVSAYSVRRCALRQCALLKIALLLGVDVRVACSFSRAAYSADMRAYVRQPHHCLSSSLAVASIISYRLLRRCTLRFVCLFVCVCRVISA